MLAALIVACSAGGSPAPTPTPPTPTLAPTPDVGAPQPDVARILEHARVLSEQIGIRPAGSPEYDQALEYAHGQLEQWGYDVVEQDFVASHSGLLRYATVTIETTPARTLRAVAFRGTEAGGVNARLVDVGTGLPEQFPPDATGAIVLLQRQDVTFADMAKRAKAAGAAGAIVVNNAAELFPGTVDPAVDGLPMASISQPDGDALRVLLPQGATVTLQVQEQMLTKNVIARPAGGAPCRTISGGHLDSVAWAPGANDNASGAALVLELARAAAAAKLSGNCFALFGAEEQGLKGSAFFVSQLTDADRRSLQAYYNYDIVAGNAQPVAVGSQALLDRAQAAAGQLGLQINIQSNDDSIASDHLNFIEAALPAVIITSPDALLFHTPQDTFANLQRATIEPIMRLAFALLQDGAPSP